MPPSLLLWIADIYAAIAFTLAAMTGYKCFIDRGPYDENRPLLVLGHILVDSVPTILKRCRGRPSILRVSEPQPK